MNRVKILGLGFILSAVFAFATQAYALKPDFQSVRDYHNQEIELLLKDYTLEDSLTIRVELIRKDGELKEQEVVNLPGLYQKTGEPNDRGIENVLNLYERKFVLIKKREISEQELELVKSSLKERLFLPDNVVYTTLDNIPKLDSAVKNLKSDFVFGAYQTLIKNGQFLWILIFSIGFIVALWVLAKAWKSKSENGLGGELTISGGGFPQGDSATRADHDDRSHGSGGPGGSISLNSTEFETFNFESLCQNISESFVKAPGSTSHVLWQYLPDLQTQIQFYEILRIQKNVDKALLGKVLDISNKVFAFEERASKKQASRRSRGFTKEDLSAISVELAKQKFITPNASYEKCLTAVYPAVADDLRNLFVQGLDGHHAVLYKLFKDEFMNFLSIKNDSSILEKINDLLTFDPESDHASDEQYQSFAQFVSSTDWATAQASDHKAVNAKVVQMIYNLPESELLQVEAMKSREDLRSEIPCFEWINLADHKLLKDFYANLSGPELKYLFDFDKKYNDALLALDDRIQFRVKERMSNEENMKLVWKDFRNKIKRFYSYSSSAKATNSGAQEHASKAS